jgi:hypothetical protein
MHMRVRFGRIVALYIFNPLYTTTSHMAVFLVGPLVATNAPYSHSDKVDGGFVHGILSVYILVLVDGKFWDLSTRGGDNIL